MLINGVVKLPCTRIGPRFIESITASEDAEFLLIKIKSIEMPLYWPYVLPLFDLYKVVTESFYSLDWHFYEVPETQVEAGDTVLDCGAAEGIFSLRVQAKAESVVAFEPLPIFGKSLHKTFANCSNVTVVSCALGDTEGEAYLKGGSLYGSVTSEKSGSPIYITTVDRWADTTGRSVQYIKGDLEGFELNVLKGAAETIQRYKPKIALTVYHPGNDWQEILAYLQRLVPDYQYRIKGISYNEAYPRPIMLHCWRAQN